MKQVTKAECELANLKRSIYEVLRFIKFHNTKDEKCIAKIWEMLKGDKYVIPYDKPNWIK